MDIRVQERDGMKIAELIGEIDGKTASAVLDALRADRQRREGHDRGYERGRVYVQRRSAHAADALPAGGSEQRQLVLVGLSEEIKETMDTTGFLTHFTLAGDIQTGMLAICEARAERWNGLISTPPTNTAVISCAPAGLTRLGRRSSRAGSIFRFFPAAPIIACWCCTLKGSASRWSRSLSGDVQQSWFR